MYGSLFDIFLLACFCCLDHFTDLSFKWIFGIRFSKTFEESLAFDDFKTKLFSLFFNYIRIKVLFGFVSTNLEVSLGNSKGCLFSNKQNK